MRLFIVLLALLLGAAPAYAVDEGAVDGARHPNVGMMGVDFDGPGPEAPSPTCSGSVISDRAFLTAGHCLEDLPPEAELFVTLEGGSPAHPMAQPALFPDELPVTFNVRLTRASLGVVHPKFDPATRAHDLAVLVFKPGTLKVTPVELPREGALDRLRKPAYRLVGYGMDPERGDDVTQFIFEGYRQTRMSAFQRLTAEHLELAGGLCMGDSGSPQLVGNLAVSLNSDAGEQCDHVVAQRLDTREEIKFLRRYL